MLSATARVAVLCCLFAGSLENRFSRKYLAQKFLANKQGWCLTQRTYKTKTDPKVLLKPLAKFYNEGLKWVVEMTYRQPPSTNVTYFAHACLGISETNAQYKGCRLDTSGRESSICADAVLFRYLVPSRREPSVPDAKLKLHFLGIADACLTAKIDQENLPIEKESAADGSDCVLFEVAGKHEDKPSPECEELFEFTCLSKPKKPMDRIIPLKLFNKPKQPPKIHTPKLPKYTLAPEPEKPSENSEATTKNSRTKKRRPKFTRAPKPEEPSENSKTTRKNRTTRQNPLNLRPAAKPEESSENSEAATKNKSTKQKRPKFTVRREPEMLFVTSKDKGEEQDPPKGVAI